tara:strand:- start:240 stop:1094 length:855 start_codon:yes stop_codon:yes gene_type:complete
MKTVTSSCYYYQTIHFEESSLDIDAVYVLTMENSDRLEKLKKELYFHKPGKVVMIQINKGFRNCSKRLCKDSTEDIDVSYMDISHAYLNAFKNAVNNQYKNVLILEDDAIFSKEYYNADNLKIINEFIPKLDAKQSLFALGLVPWISLYNSNGIRKSVTASGIHATIFPISVMKKIISDCTNIRDMDMYVNLNCTRYFSHNPLVSQTFPQTENSNNWGNDYGFLGVVIRTILGMFFWLMGLDKTAEPGTTYIYTLNKIMYDILIPILILYLLIMNIPKIYRKYK